MFADFNVRRQMSMDEAGVRQAVTAFLRNDSFYPRSNDQSRLWTVFREHYLHISKESVALCCDASEQEKRQRLLRVLIDLLEQVCSFAVD